MLDAIGFSPDKLIIILRIVVRSVTDSSSEDISYTDVSIMLIEIVNRKTNLMSSSHSWPLSSCNKCTIIQLLNVQINILGKFIKKKKNYQFFSNCTNVKSNYFVI